MAVRKLVFAMGYRYRLHRKDMPGNPDLVFPGRKKVIFVHGCFWHQHESRSCKIARKPKSNTGYWLPKLERTKQRDRHNQQKLKNSNWDVMVIWECDIENSLEITAKNIVKFLNDKK